jgi:hypothetical protein
MSIDPGEQQGGASTRGRLLGAKAEAPPAPLATVPGRAADIDLVVSEPDREPTPLLRTVAVKIVKRTTRSMLPRPG